MGVGLVSVVTPPRNDRSYKWLQTICKHFLHLWHGRIMRLEMANAWHWHSTVITKKPNSFHNDFITVSFRRFSIHHHQRAAAMSIFCTERPSKPESLSRPVDLINDSPYDSDDSGSDQAHRLPEVADQLLGPPKILGLNPTVRETRCQGRCGPRTGTG